MSDPLKQIHTTKIPVKSDIPYYVGFFDEEYRKSTENVKLSDFRISKVEHSLANNFVLNHHYLKRKLYIAKNVSYGLFANDFLVGVSMYGYPVWREYPGLVPPLMSAECPELLRVCTVSKLPRNTESYFVAKTIRSITQDWVEITGTNPVCITSLCDNSLGFSGALYKALNFSVFNKTVGRAANIGGSHGKWGGNDDKTKSEKTMYVYWFDRNRSVNHDITT